MGVPKKQLDTAIDYIRINPEIRDVLISGGDGLLINDNILEYILKNLRDIPHVEIIRIGTRAPVVFPQRITENLCNILKKYHPVWLNTHFNTSIEITEESKRACEMLANAGVPVGNQAVILAGINDSVPIMKKLMHDLVKIRVRPYYIYQCDLSEGIGHFRAPISKGLGNYGRTSRPYIRLCRSTFIVDARVEGENSHCSQTISFLKVQIKSFLRNFEGVITSYPEPENYQSGSAEEYFKKVYPEVFEKFESNGVLSIIDDTKFNLTPEGLKRLDRRKTYKENTEHSSLKENVKNVTN